VKGAINFVGGWNGTRCQHAAPINQSIFVRGSRFPGDTDLALRRRRPVLSPLAQPRELCRVPGAGGRGAFHELPPEFGGHYIWRRPDRWGPLVEDYLKRPGLSR